MNQVYTLKNVANMNECNSNDMGWFLSVSLRTPFRSQVRFGLTAVLHVP